MDDNLMFDYLLQMGAMRPEEQELARKQKMVEALRQGGMQAPEAQMVGRQMVAPSWTQYAAQLGQAYAARKGQQGVDSSMRGINDRQRQMLEDLRKRRTPAAPGASASPTPIVPNDDGYSYY